MSIINNLINKAIIKSDCLICQDDIYIDEKYYFFCCGQYYHEKCLAEYIGLNMYAKCPICHKWITKEIKEAFDVIFDKEYKLDYMREKIKQCKKFTQSDNIYNTNARSTSPITPTTEEETIPLIPRLHLTNIQYPYQPEYLEPPPPRNYRRQDLVRLAENTTNIEYLLEQLQRFTRGTGI